MAWDLNFGSDTITMWGFQLAYHRNFFGLFTYTVRAQPCLANDGPPAWF